jgi:hypothetical protein
MWLKLLHVSDVEQLLSFIPIEVKILYTWIIPHINLYLIFSIVFLWWNMYIYHSTVSKHSLSYISESENLNSSNLKMIFSQQDVFTNLIICWFSKTQLYNKNTFTNLCVRLLNFKKLYIERQNCYLNLATFQNYCNIFSRWCLFYVIKFSDSL